MSYKINYSIYKIKNKITNQCYIGVDSYYPKRIKQHQSRLRNNKHRNKHLQASYNKYGIENLRFEILEYCDSEKCIELEDKWLQYYIQNHNVYNINKIHPSKLGYITSEETKKKISESRDKKKVYQFDFDGNLVKEWICFNHILKEFPTGRSSIWRCLNNLQQTGYNYIWSYNNKFEFKSFNQSKPVLQYDLNNNFIKEWKSAKEASEHLCIQQNSISLCCRNKRKKAGNFNWKFKNKNDE